MKLVRPSDPNCLSPEFTFRGRALQREGWQLAVVVDRMETLLGESFLLRTEQAHSRING